MGGAGGAGFGLFNGGLSSGATSRSGSIGGATFGGINIGNDKTTDYLIIGALVLVVGLIVFKK